MASTTSLTSADLSVRSLLSSLFARFLLVGAALACLAGVAVFGPMGPIGMACLGLPVLAVLVLLMERGFTPPLPAVGLLLIIPPIGPGFYVFDAVALLFGLAALYATLRSPDRKAWDIRMPGALALCALAVPLIALPNVVSFFSFLGSYKQILAEVAVFFGIRRLIRPGESKFLLAIFPLTGTVAALELINRTRAYGFKLYADLTGRTVFTDLGWGRSNFVAAFLVVCLGGTLIFALLEKRTWIRGLLAISSAVMLAAFVLLVSRAATVALGVMVAILLIAWGGRRVVAAGALVAGLAASLFATRGGQVTLGRFSDPSEYASWYTRTLAWGYAWQRVLAHPWTGIGLNQGRYQADMLGRDDAHDIMLDYLMHQGILGGVVLVAVVVALYRLCLRARPVGWTASTHGLKVALIAVTTAIFVNASVEPTLSGYPVAILFAWFAAWLALQDERATGRAESGTTKA